MTFEEIKAELIKRSEQKVLELKQKASTTSGVMAPTQRLREGGELVGYLNDIYKEILTENNVVFAGNEESELQEYLKPTMQAIFRDVVLAQGKE